MTEVPLLDQAWAWRFIGPPRGGRVVAVAGDPEEVGVFYFGSCGGGVWKTTDAGSTWRNLTDGQLGTVAVGALAVAGSDPQVIYVGTGEACPRNDVIQGDGVYRSTDGGRHWQHRGLPESRQIARVRVSPNDPDLVYVAALGDIFGPSADRGVYRSHDGGASWERVLAGGSQAGAADLWMAPGNPRLLFATLWEAVREPWGFSSGGPGSRLFRSTDGGDSWTDLTDRPGLPGSLRGRMGVAGAPTRHTRVWALIEAGEGQGGLYRSEDGGDSWERISEDRSLLGRPWYYSHIVPDPLDDETLYAMNYNFARSTDGGRTWVQVGTPHGDNHDLWIDPRNPRRLIEGNDGGACVSLNGGETFSTVYNQPTGAFYKIAVDDHFPYRVYGTQQDNSAIRVPSRSSRGAILRDQCEPVGHAESGYIVVDPRDDNIVYSGAVGSSGGGGAPLLRHDHRTDQTSLITIWPEWTYAEDPGSWRHRFSWTFPILLSRHDPAVLYAAGECVFRTRDEGHSWEAISGDLSRNDPEKLRASGGPITKDTSGAEVYCTVSVLAESPHDPQVIWAGTDDGLLHRTLDGGASWTRMKVDGLPEWAWITGLEVSPHDPQTVLLAATRYRLQDPAPYLFRTVDGGRTWEPATAGMAAGDVLRVVRADPSCPGLWYAGTEHRPYYSCDGGASWRSLQLNLPPVPVYDLVVKGGDLVAATHGRGFWILDDASSLFEVTAPGGLSSPQLVVPPLVHRYFTGEGAPPKERRTQYRETAVAVVEGTTTGSLQTTVLDAGVNPPDGVVIRYYLGEEIDPDRLEMRFLDEDGVELRRFRGRRALPQAMAAGSDEGSPEELEPAVLDASPGLHRQVWNLCLPGARLRNPVLRSMVGEDGSVGTDGPRIPPGRYRVEMRVGDLLREAEFTLRADPQGALPESAYAEQFHLLVRVRDTQVAVNEAIERCRRLRAETVTWQERADGSDLLRTAAASVAEELSRVESELTQPGWRWETDEMELAAGLDGRLFTLRQVLDRADGAPTAQAQQVAEMLFQRCAHALEELDQLVATRITELNTQIQQEHLPPIREV